MSPDDVPITKAGPAMRSLLVALAILLTTAAGLARGDDPLKDWPQSHMTGTVRDADGKPIVGAKVHLNGATGPNVGSGSWVFTGADGKYTLGVRVKPDSKV